MGLEPKGIDKEYAHAAADRSQRVAETVPKNVDEFIPAETQLRQARVEVQELLRY